jgi:phosphatidylserine/phosphatidylglycerophosphate/cardiolipin synthase-like enzyme
MDAQLVITAPAPHAEALAYATRCRSTIGVLVQLVAEAEKHVAISAPYIQSELFEAGSFGDAVRSALDRKVAISLLSTRETLARTEIKQLVGGFGSALTAYYPAFPEFEASQLGSHAKFCISDDRGAYVGSANLTTPGLSKHFELGVLVRGTAAKQMRAFWDFAVRYKLFHQQSLESPWRNRPMAQLRCVA